MFHCMFPVDIWDASPVYIQKFASSWWKWVMVKAAHNSASSQKGCNVQVAWEKAMEGDPKALDNQMKNPYLTA